MKIGVLQTGTVAPELIGQHGPYVTMFERMLKAADPAFSVSLWDVNEKHEIPASPHEAEGWIVTGSRHGVYEDHAWIEPLKSFLRAVHADGTPMVGVCFGHQIMAEALGGKVEKSERGWGCGIHEYTLSERPEWMDEPKETIAIHAMHQDQVVAVPPGARVLAGSDFCPYAALAYGETAMSVQPHPEFDGVFQRGIINLRRGSAIPAERADAALAGIDGPTDSEMFGRWITRFFRHAAAQPKAA